MDTQQAVEAIHRDLTGATFDGLVATLLMVLKEPACKGALRKALVKHIVLEMSMRVLKEDFDL